MFFFHLGKPESVRSGIGGGEVGKARGEQEGWGEEEEEGQGNLNHTCCRAYSGY